MSEVENFEGFTFTYDTGRGYSDLHLAVKAIGKFRYSHAQLDESKLRCDGSPARALQLPLIKILELSVDLTENTPESRAALLELSIDPYLN